MLFRSLLPLSPSQLAVRVRPLPRLRRRALTLPETDLKQKPIDPPSLSLSLSLSLSSRRSWACVESYGPRSSRPRPARPPVFGHFP